MASYLAQLYIAYPKQRICAFIWFVVDAENNNFMFIGSKENKILSTIRQNIILHNITFQFDQPMYSILSKKKQKLYLNYQN